MHKARTQDEFRAQAAKMLGTAGVKNVKTDKSSMASIVHQHKRALHPGKPLTALARGGKVRKPSNVTVNVIHGDEQAAQQRGMQTGVQQGMKQGVIMGAQAATQHLAPPGGPAGGPPGAPPPGNMPPAGMRPPGMATGGGIKAPKLAGAASGEGRLQKTAKYGAKKGGVETVAVKAHVRRKGGVV